MTHPPIMYCIDCGSRLIRKHYVLMRREDTSWAVYRTFEKEVPPTCVYQSAHEEEAKGKRRAAR